MSNQRQDARREICKILDEAVADLHKIKRHALHMDAITVLAMAKITAHRWNQLIAIYKRLDNVTLPPEKKIIVPEQFNLE